ncbi:MAG: ATP phosphoribosyltransferase, partial [Candidatus Binatia bacterium]
MRELKLGLPKGSLEAATVDLFRKSGWKISGMDRSYFPSIDDAALRCSLVRAQEISRYVESGSLDAGITGKDWTQENESDVQVVAELVYAKASFRPVRWVLAVPQDSPAKKIEDLRGKKIATEMVNFTRRLFSERKIPVEVEFSWGATEAKAAEGLVDAVVEVTETG